MPCQAARWAAPATAWRRSALGHVMQHRKTVRVRWYLANAECASTGAALVTPRLSTRGSLQAGVLMCAVLVAASSMGAAPPLARAADPQQEEHHAQRQRDQQAEPGKAETVKTEREHSSRWTTRARRALAAA